MTRRLEEEFNLASIKEAIAENAAVTELDDPSPEEIEKALERASKISTALTPIITLEDVEAELDELSELAKNSYKDLMDLGMNADGRIVGEIFSSAVNMLKNAITAQSQKAEKRIKAIEAELKRIKLENDLNDNDSREVGGGDGYYIERNALQKRLEKNK